MYRCCICNAVSKPREPLNRKIVYREDGSIAQEISCCKSCAVTTPDEPAPVFVGIVLEPSFQLFGVPIR